MPVTRVAPKRYQSTGYSGLSTVSNTTTRTDFSLQHTLAANTIRTGKAYRITARGTYSSAASGQGNVEIRFCIGTIVVATTTSFLMSAGVNSRMWDFCLVVLPTSSGVAASQESLGRATFNTINQVVASSVEVKWPYGANPTIDTTATNILALSAQFTVANIGNSISLAQLLVEELG